LREGRGRRSVIGRFLLFPYSLRCTEAADVDLTFMTDQGQVPGPRQSLAPGERHSFNIADTVESYNVSTIVTSSKPVVVSRSQYFGPPV